MSASWHYLWVDQQSQGIVYHLDDGHPELTEYGSTSDSCVGKCEFLWVFFEVKSLWNVDDDMETSM